MTSIEKKKMCRDISYTALKIGNGCIRVLGEDEMVSKGFDLESLEG